jgi:hypothetical protein
LKTALTVNPSGFSGYQIIDDSPFKAAARFYLFFLNFYILIFPIKTAFAAIPFMFYQFF